MTILGLEEQGGLLQVLDILPHTAALLVVMGKALALHQQQARLFMAVAVVAGKELPVLRAEHLFMGALAVMVERQQAALTAQPQQGAVEVQLLGQHLAQALAANFASGGLCNESTRN
jgi:hypothetical protein